MLLSIIVIVFLIVFFYFAFNEKRRQDEAGIMGILTERQDMELSQYAIKSSYNTAYDGSLLTLDQCTTVLKRGCRFLDFEVFSSENNTPYVGYSTDPTLQIIKGIDPNNPTKTLTLGKTLSHIAAKAFSNEVPNGNDPLFIHLRIKTQNPALYKAVALAIYDTVYAMLYKDTTTGNAKPVDRKTILRELMGKIVVVIDQSIDPEYKKYSVCEPEERNCKALNTMTNMESGGTNWRKLVYSADLEQVSLGGMSSLILDEKTKNRGVKRMDNSPVELMMVMPPTTDINPSNPNFSTVNKYIAGLGCQTLPFLFYKADNSLLWYETLFQTYHTAFVPMGYVISFIKSQEELNPALF